MDEAATALTRMKSEKQTYEAFLKGAGQAPSLSPQHSSPLTSVTQLSASNGSVKISADVTVGSRQPQKPNPQHPPLGEAHIQSSVQSKGQLQQQPQDFQEQTSDSMQSLQRLLTQGE